MQNRATTPVAHIMAPTMARIMADLTPPIRGMNITRIRTTSTSITAKEQRNIPYTKKIIIADTTTTDIMHIAPFPHIIVDSKRSLPYPQQALSLAAFFNEDTAK